MFTSFSRENKEKKDIQNILTEIKQDFPFFQYKILAMGALNTLIKKGAIGFKGNEESNEEF